MHGSRRHFLSSTGALAAGAFVRPAFSEQSTKSLPAFDPLIQDPVEQEQPDPRQITEGTIAEAEKIAGLEFTDVEREMMVQGLRGDLRGYEQRRGLPLPNGLGPAHVFDPRLPGMSFETEQHAMRFSDADPGPLPERDEDIAFAPVTALSHWIGTGQINSRRLTSIYLKRLREIGPKLQCTITLTSDLAMEQARRADRQMARGEYRGPLHGIPWGAKDLLDTAGIITSWGAMPYKDRVPDSDAAVVRMLEAAGAVLVAKLTLGALAMGDVWYGGRTNNPFNPDQGSSGSSAGSAAATAAGIVGFGIGTETLGSIVSPCMRCGTTGLRPTFGRVPRSGAMALCWSLDKIGPICRTVEDTMMVLDAIRGHDPGDASSVDMPCNFDATASIRGMRVGYSPAWFDGRRVSPDDKRCIDLLRRLGVELVEVKLPEWPYGALRSILSVEAAAAFEELTLSGRDDLLVRQGRGAWPNSFRQAWFTPAVEVMQAERFRRLVCEMMAEQFEKVEAMISPSYAASLLLITNNTGHPSLTIRNGFSDNGSPRGITMIGRLYEEGRLCNLGMALEKELDVWHKRPELT